MSSPKTTKTVSRRKSRAEAHGATSRIAAESERLRREAEALLAHSPPAEQSAQDDALRLVHELRVHQIELEMQNEALLATNAAIAEDLACFTELGERGPVGYFSVALDGTIVRMNLAGAGLLGLTDPDARRKPLCAYVTRASRPVFNAFLDEVFDAQNKQVCEIDFGPTPNGSCASVHMEGVADPARRCCHLAVINISERKRAQEALRESEAFRLAILDSLTEHIAVLDTEGTIVAVNAAWRRFATENDAPTLAEHSIGMSYRSVCETAASYRHAEHAVEAWAGIEGVLSGWNNSFTLDYPCHGPNAARYFRMNVFPLVSPRGGAVVSHANITTSYNAAATLTRAHNEAKRADQAKSRFLAAASHDLRQPLTALGLYVGTLNQVLGTQHPRLLQSMTDCVSSLSKLLTDLLDLSKLEAGVITPALRDFAVDSLINRVLSAQAPQAQLKGLRMRHVSRGIFVRSDPALLERMILNLVANAVRYTERGGILIGCRRRHGKTWLEVWDTGIGIPAHMTDEIFEEFRQLGGHKDDGGSGLGLAIVARTAVLLNLQIRVKSREGKGSMFAIELPPGRANRTIAHSQPERRHLRIALVDDNERVLDALEYSLGAIGHQVIAAPSGKALAARLVGEAPDVVISDYRLAAGETGLDVIDHCKSMFGAALPAILITGDTDPHVLRTMTRRGIVVQHKPLELDLLLNCLAELTERRSTSPHTSQHGN